MYQPWFCCGVKRTTFKFVRKHISLILLLNHTFVCDTSLRIETAHSWYIRESFICVLLLEFQFRYTNNVLTIKSTVSIDGTFVQRFQT